MWLVKIVLWEGVFRGWGDVCGLGLGVGLVVIGRLIVGGGDSRDENESRYRQYRNSFENTNTVDLSKSTKSRLLETNKNQKNC